MVKACKCDGVEIQEYQSQVLLAEHPTMKSYFDKREDDNGERPKGIPVDDCLALEITQLWNAGIRTYGCCCGHNKVRPMINIDPKDMKAALRLGYEISREDTIIPKSVQQTTNPNDG